MNKITEPKIIVHGGAGTWKESPRLEQALSACSLAAAEGQKILMSSGSALQAVEAAVRILEDDPALDAGRGSYPNTKGQIEMDALIMDGATLNLGAAAAVQRIRNPITLARLIMTDNDHNLLVGRGAEEFAESCGIERCELQELIYHWSDTDTPESMTATQSIAFSKGPTSDTVGAAAADLNGNLAAATSTGGTMNKKPGRVGDSPLVGSGAYADNMTAAVSATGDGESLMKIVVSKQVCEFVATGSTAAQACADTIQILGERVNGYGGLIAIDHFGNIGASFNTPLMPHAAAEGSNLVVVKHSSPIVFQ